MGAPAREVGLLCLGLCVLLLKCRGGCTAAALLALDLGWPHAWWTKGRAVLHHGGVAPRWHEVPLQQRRPHHPHIWSGPGLGTRPGAFWYKAWRFSYKAWSSREGVYRPMSQRN